MMRKPITLIVILGAGAITWLGFIAHADNSFSAHVTDQGEINFPADFRSSMVHLGSWFVPEGSASGFHDVFTEKESVEHFQKNGRFPDGATLVKELRGSSTGSYTTGSNVSHSTSELKQWFVMVKDGQGRFENNPKWGDGWGWALFKGDNMNLDVVKNYTTDCLGCHVPAKSNDWIYTEAYPILEEQ